MLLFIYIIIIKYLHDIIIDEKKKKKKVFKDENSFNIFKKSSYSW